MKRSVAVLSILLSSVFAISCATYNVAPTTTRFEDAPVLEPSNPVEVVIYSKAPAEPYVQLGEIHLKLEGNWLGREVPADPKIVNSLQAEAARLGANAVVYVVVQQSAGGLRPGKLQRESGRNEEVVATAVRLKS